MGLLDFFATDKVNLGGRHVAVLAAIESHPAGICAADATTAIERVLGRDVRLATVYDTVLDLEGKGLIRQSGLSRAESGGRPRRLFSLTETGNLALTLFRGMADHRDASAA